MKKLTAAVRKATLAVASNQSLFLFASFVMYILVSVGPLRDYMTVINLIYSYVIVPWGLALCLMRLYRAESRREAVRLDLAVLYVLVAWIVVPFALRFGVTANNMGCWQGYIVAYFGVYASITEESSEQRGKLLGQASALFAALSIVLGGMLLYCAATGETLGEGIGEDVFGLFRGMFLSAGQHYNSTGMICVCCLMLSLAGFERSKRALLRLYYGLAAVIMLVVIVLTQSRTARYAAILGLGAGIYQLVVTAPWVKRRLMRWAAGALAAVAVMGGLYVGASALTNAAFDHYARVQNARMAGEEARLSIVKAAVAEEETEKPKQLTAQELGLRPRAAVDESFSGRTDIWRGLLEEWKENPKYLFIGFGMGNIGRRVAARLAWSGVDGIPMHNTYLQYIADLGLIGFGILLAFFAVIARPACRAAFAPRGDARPGTRALLMYVVAALATGFMESRPLGGMTSMGMVLMFALAFLFADGKETRHL